MYITKFDVTSHWHKARANALENTFAMYNVRFIDNMRVSQISLKR